MLSLNQENIIAYLLSDDICIHRNLSFKKMLFAMTFLTVTFLQKE